MRPRTSVTPSPRTRFPIEIPILPKFKKTDASFATRSQWTRIGSAGEFVVGEPKGVDEDEEPVHSGDPLDRHHRSRPGGDLQRARKRPGDVGPRGLLRDRQAREASRMADSPSQPNRRPPGGTRGPQVLLRPLRLRKYLRLQLPHQDDRRRSPPLNRADDSMGVGLRQGARPLLISRT